MKVYNEQKTEILENPDLKLGYLKPDKILVTIHEHQPEVKEVWHYETVKEYPNGGKEVKKVIDTPYQSEMESYDEFEDIQVYVSYTQKELNAQKIDELKNNLALYDYIGTKIATGRATKEEYAEQIAQMTEWADEISRLREEIKAAEEINTEPIENSCQIIRDKV